MSELAKKLAKRREKIDNESKELAKVSVDADVSHFNEESNNSTFKIENNTSIVILDDKSVRIKTKNEGVVIACNGCNVESNELSIFQHLKATDVSTITLRLDSDSEINNSNSNSNSVNEDDDVNGKGKEVIYISVVDDASLGVTVCPVTIDRACGGLRVLDVTSKSKSVSPTKEITNFCINDEIVAVSGKSIVSMTSSAAAEVVKTSKNRKFTVVRAASSNENKNNDKDKDKENTCDHKNKRSHDSLDSDEDSTSTSAKANSNSNYNWSDSSSKMELHAIKRRLISRKLPGKETLYIDSNLVKVDYHRQRPPTLSNDFIQSESGWGSHQGTTYVNASTKMRKRIYCSNSIVDNEC